jgi:hypothetical protein
MPTRLLPLLLLALIGCGDGPLLEPSPGRVAARDTLTRSLDLRGRTLVLDGHDGSVRIRADTVERVELVLIRTARGLTAGSAEERLGSLALYEVEGDEVAQFVWSSRLEGTGVWAEARVPPDADLVVELDAGTIYAAGLDSARATLRADSVFRTPAALPVATDSSSSTG